VVEAFSISLGKLYFKGVIMPESKMLRLRGLPWSVTKGEIVDFFDPIPLKDGESGVEIMMGFNGRPSGEALVTLESADDLMEAEKKHNKHIGSRYVEVFPVRDSEMVRRAYRGNIDDCIVRLRGLPYRCSKEEILDFFSGLEIVSNGIILPMDHQGRHTGDAYVEFVNSETAEKSMDRHKEKIGHRYIEIFKSNEMEMRSAADTCDMGGRGGYGGGYGRPAPYDSRDRFGGPNRYGSSGSSTRAGPRYDDYQGPGGYSGGWGGRDGGRDRYSEERRGRGSRDRDSRGSTGHCVHMRGLPFRATEDDVFDFFRPVAPTHVTFNTDHTGRASGEADVEFASHDDAVRAMSKDKQNMNHRYIELFLNSSGGGSDYSSSRRY